MIRPWDFRFSVLPVLRPLFSFPWGKKCYQIRLPSPCLSFSASHCTVIHLRGRLLLDVAKSSHKFDFAGHYRHYPVDYKAAVSELLGKAAAIYSQRNILVEHEKLGFEGARDAISDPMFNLSRATAGPSRGSPGLTLALSDQFLVPTSVESHNGVGLNFGSVQDNHEEGIIHLPARPSINAHGVLGQILFDVCVPRDVEDWDIKQSYYSGRRPFISSRRHAAFNPIKCMLRSRL